MKKHPSADSTSLRMTILLAIALYALTCFPPFGGTKGGCQNIGINSTGATPDPSAMLDIVNTSKGLLIPRVALFSVTDAATIPTPAASLMVYSQGGALTDGYYYNSGTTLAPVWTNVGNPHHDFMPVNLVIENDAVNPNFQVDITASSMSAEGVLLTNVNVSADITAAGAGGLDAGAEAINTWYYIFVITNNSGTSVNALLSTSSTAPTLPAGYTKKRRVGAVRNDASSNFLQFRQEGNKVNYTRGGDVWILSAGQATSFTTVSAANFIPSTSRRGVFDLLSQVSHNTANVNFACRMRQPGSLATIGQLVAANVSQVAGVEVKQRIIGDVETNASQQVDYMIANVPSNFGGAQIAVLGYYDRL